MNTLLFSNLYLLQCQGPENGYFVDIYLSILITQLCKEFSNDHKKFTPLTCISDSSHKHLDDDH